MYISIIFEICSFLYILILSVIYFRKQRINNIENKIYSNLVIQDILILITEFLCCMTGVLNLDSNSILVHFVSRILLSLIIFWAISFGCYIYAITHEGEKNKLHGNTSLIRTITFILSLLTLALPLEYYKEGMTTYSYGIGVIYTYSISILCIFFEVVCIIKNYSKINKKKIYPLILLIFLIVVMVLFKMFIPGLNLIASVFTIVIFLMYFTIENPDLKMIEQLNMARDQAEKANNAKTDFLSNMSHEIRTPLNAIIGFSQALLEEDIPPSAKEEVRDIVMASDNLLELVNGILDISKLEANKLEIVNTEYSLSKVLNDLVILTKARIGEKPIEFRTNFDSSAPAYLYGDYTRLKQIVLNLLTNAAKYTKEGYIEFKVSTVKKDDICRLIISVEDTGIGIQSDKIDKLFNKFERLDLDKNITIEGTGLGLAITKKLVDLMQGKIVVQSDYGHGSKFTVAIDQRIIATPTKPLDETPTVVDNVDITGTEILVVDDNKINLKVAERLLKDTNAIVTLVSSGMECIEILKTKTFDLILLDDMMPTMSGVDTFKKLKEDPNFKIPTVMMTANAIEGMREKYLNEGFNDYLSKPINRKELNTILMKYRKKNDV